MEKPRKASALVENTVEEAHTTNLACTRTCRKYGPIRIKNLKSTFWLTCIMHVTPESHNQKMHVKTHQNSIYTAYCSQDKNTTSRQSHTKKSIQTN